MDQSHTVLEDRASWKEIIGSIPLPDTPFDKTKQLGVNACLNFSEKFPVLDLLLFLTWLFFLVIFIF